MDWLESIDDSPFVTQLENEYGGYRSILNSLLILQS